MNKKNKLMKALVGLELSNKAKQEFCDIILDKSNNESGGEGGSGSDSSSIKYYKRNGFTAMTSDEENALMYRVVMYAGNYDNGITLNQEGPSIIGWESGIWVKGVAICDDMFLLNVDNNGLEEILSKYFIHCTREEFAQILGEY